MVNTPKNLPKLHKYSKIAEQREAVEKCAYLYTLPTYSITAKIVPRRYNFGLAVI